MRPHLSIAEPPLQIGAYTESSLSPFSSAPATVMLSDSPWSHREGRSQPHNSKKVQAIVIQDQQDLAFVEP